MWKIKMSWLIVSIPQEVPLGNTPLCLPLAIFGPRASALFLAFKVSNPNLGADTSLRPSYSKFCLSPWKVSF